MDDIAERLERTREATQESVARLLDLQLHIEQVTELANLIHDIAQTSTILALNAALEGIHAGEAGRSFSLVAHEMQSLAERVRSSVADVRTLTHNLLEGTQSTSKAVETSSVITDEVARSSQGIKALAADLNAGATQLTGAVDEIQRVATNVSRQTDETLDMSTQLEALSTELDEVSSSFRLP